MVMLPWRETRIRGFLPRPPGDLAGLLGDFDGTAPLRCLPALVRVAR